MSIYTREAAHNLLNYVDKESKVDWKGDTRITVWMPLGVNGEVPLYPMEHLGSIRDCRICDNGIESVFWISEGEAVRVTLPLGSKVTCSSYYDTTANGSSDPAEFEVNDEQKEVVIYCSRKGDAYSFSRGFVSYLKFK